MLSAAAPSAFEIVKHLYIVSEDEVNESDGHNAVNAINLNKIATTIANTYCLGGYKVSKLINLQNPVTWGILTPK